MEIFFTLATIFFALGLLFLIARSRLEGNSNFTEGDLNQGGMLGVYNIILAGVFLFIGMIYLLLR